MARPLRREFPDALYHITSRGDAQGYRGYPRGYPGGDILDGPRLFADGGICHYR